VVSRALGVYARMIAVQIRSQAQYPGNFWLSAATSVLYSGLDLAAVFITFSNVDSLAGWTLPEVLLLYAAASFSYSIADGVLGALDGLPEMVRRGIFDILLSRPASSLLQTVTSSFSLGRIARFLQAFAILIIAIGWNRELQSGQAVLLLAVAIACGAIIFGSLWVIAASSAFWVVEAGEFVNAFTSGALFLTQYPVRLFGDWLERVVLTVFPIGFVIYVPAAFLLGKDDVPAWLVFCLPVAVAGCVTVASLAWRRAIGHYTSAGG
jgi:ABC-2 type transport system permease protein